MGVSPHPGGSFAPSPLRSSRGTYLCTSVFGFGSSVEFAGRLWRGRKEGADTVCSELERGESKADSGRKEGRKEWVWGGEMGCDIHIGISLCMISRLSRLQCFRNSTYPMVWLIVGKSRSPEIVPIHRSHSYAFLHLLNLPRSRPVSSHLISSPTASRLKRNWTEYHHVCMR